MPFFAELASASDVRDGEDTLASLNEFEDGSAEERVNGNVETPVSCDAGSTSSTASVRISKEREEIKRTILIARSGPI